MRLLPSSQAPKPPTALQREVMERIQTLTEHLGKPPALAALGTHHANLELLRLRGWVNWDASKANSIHITTAGQQALQMEVRP